MGLFYSHKKLIEVSWRMLPAPQGIMPGSGFIAP
jgi:hypothetical protein